MENLFFLILAVVSLFVFFNLGKIKASKKQTNRGDRISRFRADESQTRESIINETKESNKNKIFKE